MFRCWHTDPEERQTFSELVRIMSQMLLTMADYLDVSTFGELEEEREESNVNGVDDDECKKSKDGVYYDNENKSLVVNLTA